MNYAEEISKTNDKGKEGGRGGGNQKKITSILIEKKVKKKQTVGDD